MRRRLSLLAIGWVVALCGAAAVSAASAASTMNWRPAGLWGGDVRAIEIDPRDPDYVLAGTSSGQVFLSRDGGGNWLPAGEPVAFSGGWVVQDLLFDPNQTQRVWAAVARAWDEKGFVAVSDDRGRTWQVRSEGLPERQVYSLAAIPGRPGILYAGTRVGVYGSRDHGRSWKHLTRADRAIRKVTSLHVDADRPGLVIAGTWRRAYRSEDGGSTWRRLNNGMILDSEVFSLQPVPGKPGELWASTCGWVYRGRGHGNSWQRFQSGLTERRTPSFRVLPSGRLLAGTVAGIFGSDDGGASWKPAGATGLAVHALTHHPGRPEVVYAGSEGGGVWRSDDSGRTFTQTNRGLNALRVAGLVEVAGELVVAVRNAGTASGVYSSFDGGSTFPVGPVRLPTILKIAADGDRIYAATEKGLWRREGSTWEKLGELGDRRMEDVVAHEGGVLVRSRRMMWERGEEGFRRIEPDGAGPAAAAAAAAAVLMNGSERRALPPDLWVAEEDVSSVLVHNGRLLLGTVGYGVLMADLAPAERTPTPTVPAAR